ncbi:hypothetical protein GCM10027443_01190 [Pontibacter brevis]
MHHLEERDQRNMRGNQDEIDIAVIFEYIGRFFQRIGEGIAYTFRAIWRHLTLVVLICMVGVGLGYAAFKVTKPYFVSSMTLVLADIRNEFVENQLNNLAEMIREENFVAVSSNLEISPEDARKIKDLSFTNLDQNRVPVDSVLQSTPFRLELSLYDNVMFESMEPAITNYLESNRYFLRQKLIRQRKIESLIAKIKDDIATLDSLKTNVASPRGPVNGFVYGEPIDPTNLYRESMALYEEQVKLQAELEQIETIQVVNGFAPRFRPTGPSLLRFLLIGGALALTIGIVAALALEARNRNRLSY